MIARKTALALLALAACSGGGSGDPTDGGGTTAPETVAAYCDQLWTAYAARWAVCDGGSAAYYAAYFDPALRCADAVQAVAAGRATYQRSSAGACLDFVATAVCDALEAHEDGRSPAPACLAAVAGLLATGADCYSNESCASDACPGTELFCPNTCGARGGLGASCGLGLPCTPGLQCETVDPAKLGTCQLLKAVGALCMGDPDCQPGLRCQPGYYAPATCQPRLTSGACSYEWECAIAYKCIGGECLLPKGPGEACTQGANECGAGLWCSGGHCVDGPTAGYSCASVGGEVLPCTGSACDPGSTECVAWSEGSACVLSPDCAPTMSCTGSHLCTTPCGEP